MSADPLLVLQLRRMGDLVLTFPLFQELRRAYPANPLLVVAEPQFFKGLQPFAPGCAFLSPDVLPELAKGKYQAVINLSSQKEAALTAARAAAEVKLGALAENGVTRIAGFWQLYRAALTHNNRHNVFHWADLFRLDCGFPLSAESRSRKTAAAPNRIALFVGASEPSKRPDAEFWISLARRLKNSGKVPILLGGSVEKELGAEIARRVPVPNFCGKTDLSQLAGLLSTAEMLITPDTGPMHLADWLGVPILNLSLGNVSPFETGPYSPGQWIAQASMSCAGCWRCWRGRQYCRNAFTPRAIADAALAILSPPSNPMEVTGHDLAFFRSDRDEHGLYDLSGSLQSASTLLNGFWKQLFLIFSGYAPAAAAANSAQFLYASYPRLAHSLHRHLADMIKALGQCQKKGVYLPENFWQHHPWHSRLFAGFLQMFLQNDDYSRAAWLNIMQYAVITEEILSQSA